MWFSTLDRKLTHCDGELTQWLRPDERVPTRWPEPAGPRQTLQTARPSAPYHERVPADCFRHEALGVVFQVRDQRLNVLLWRREQAPFEGAWALPGGLLLASERLGASASRHLAAKVDIPEISHLEQLETRSDPVRDPRERVLATAYLALVTPEARPRLPSDTAWHWVDELPECAFDHGSIIGSARERLRAKPVSYTHLTLPTICSV